MQANHTEPLAGTAGSSESPWVACVYRMPEDGQRVQVMDREGNHSLAIYVCEDGLYGWMLETRPEAWGRWPKMPPISHWRPMDPPPNATTEDRS